LQKTYSNNYGINSSC